MPGRTIRLYGPLSNSCVVGRAASGLVCAEMAEAGGGLGLRLQLIRKTPHAMKKISRTIRWLIDASRIAYPVQALQLFQIARSFQGALQLGIGEMNAETQRSREIHSQITQISQILFLICVICGSNLFFFSASLRLCVHSSPPFA